MEWLLLTGRMSLAALLMLAGFSKFAMRREFQQTLERVVVVPSSCVRFLLVGLPVVELATAAGLIETRTSFTAAVVALILFMGFAVVTGLQLWLTEDRGACNCYWNADRLSWKTPARNVACASVAMAIAWPQLAIGFGSLAAALLLATLRSMEMASDTGSRKAIAS